MPPWADLYRPLLGRPLEGAAFLPILCDTQKLVDELRTPGFWFSGIVHLAFAPQLDLYLTWEQQRSAIGLVGAPINRFVVGRFGLDRSNMSSDEPWNALIGAVLVSVDVFASLDMSEDIPVAIRHRLRAGSNDTALWVCTGYEPNVGDGDDLFVSIDAPPALAGLRPLATFDA